MPTGYRIRAPPYITESVLLHINWTRSRVDPSQVCRLKLLPLSNTLEYAGTRFAFLHCPLAADALDRDFAFLDADVVFIGHIHMPFEHAGQRLIHDPGSVGTGSNSSTRFSVLTLGDGTYRNDRYEIGYDKTPVFDALVRRDVPEREAIVRIFLGG